MSGIERIATERQRQLHQEGWTPEHDDQYDGGELARAAGAYCLAEASRNPDEHRHFYPMNFWPWDEKWWKPSPNNRIRELEKAGALIAAEIDRLERQSNLTNSK